MKLLLRNVNVIRSSSALGALIRTRCYARSSRIKLSDFTGLGSRTITRLVYAPTENPPGYRLSLCRLQSTTRTPRSLGIALEMRPVAVLKKEAIPSSIAKEDSVRTKEPSYTSSEESGHAGKQNQSRTIIEAERQPPSLSQNIEMNGRDMRVDILNLKDDVVSNSAAPVLRNKSGNRLGRQGTEGSLEERRTLLREIHNVRRVSSDNVEIFAPKRQHSFRDDVGHAAAETFLLTRLTFNLLRYLGVGYRWITKFLALGLYAIFLMPGFIQVGYKYFFSKNVHRSIVYGREPRNRLDLYMPEDTSEPRPVVIFITGGAWIIGYKAWGALLGLQLCERDIMVCCVDYRNFPQGGISDMVQDVSTGIGFIVNNIHRYGGDPDRIFLGGQSAGSHIAACGLIEQARIEIGQKEGVMTWKPSQIKAFLGLSGGYNLPKLVDHFHKRGLYRSIFLSIMEGETSLPLYSPELAVRSNAFTPAVNLLPTMYLFHGTADYSIPYEASVMFGNALRDVGATVVTKFYADKTHTDVFLQDPMRGGYDALFEDLVAVVHADDEEATAKDAQASLRPRLVPEFLLRLARVVSPF